MFKCLMVLVKFPCVHLIILVNFMNFIFKMILFFQKLLIEILTLNIHPSVLLLQQP